MPIYLGRLAINLQTCKYDVLREVSTLLGYKEADEEEENWDLCWSDLSVSIERVSKLKPFQRLNHFPSMLEICRKAQLSRHMSRMACRLPEEFDFHPASFKLPDQLDDLIGILKRNKSRMEQGLDGVQTFILKPSSGTMGRGIHLVQTVAQLSEVDVSNVVAQHYINNPLLLDGYKFDLRIYALVLSVDPLQIYLYDEGLARLATVPYSQPTSANIRTATMHLTNYSVNKGSSSFVESESGTKRPASSVMQQVADRRGVPMSRLVGEISAIINKTVLSIQPQLAHTYHTAISSGGREASDQRAACPCLSLDHHSQEAAACTCPSSQCFEVLGFDILLDDNLKAWLVEVNHSPSFGCDARLDKQVKSSLIADTMLALNQKSEERLNFFDAQLKAQNERLYSAPSISGVRRPLSGLPRSRQLSSTAKAIDEVLNASPPRQSPPSSTRVQHHTSDSGHTSVSSRWYKISHQLQDHESVLGPGFVSGGGSSASAPSIGRYHQILPSPDGKERSRYLKIFATASDAFPDQRCGCSWCTRRLRVRHMASTAMEIYAVTGNQRHRPFSASPAIGSGANAVLRPSSAIRSLSQMGHRPPGGHLQRASCADTGSPADQPGGETGHDSPSSSANADRTSAGKPPKPSGHSGPSPIVFNPALGGGQQQLELSLGSTGSLGDPLTSHQSHRELEVGWDSDCSPSSSTSSPPLMDLSSKIDRHLARYLRALHSSCPRYRGALKLPSSPKDVQSERTVSSSEGPGGGSKPRMQSASSQRLIPGPDPSRAAVKYLGASVTRALSARPSVPRVARLASAHTKSSSSRDRLQSSTVDHELMAMRVMTGAMLSNSFVSCYSTLDQQGVNDNGVKSRLGSARSSSARIVR